MAPDGPSGPCSRAASQVEVGEAVLRKSCGSLGPLPNPEPPPPKSHSKAPRACPPWDHPLELPLLACMDAGFCVPLASGTYLGAYNSHLEAEYPGSRLLDSEQRTSQSPGAQRIQALP